VKIQLDENYHVESDAANWTLVCTKQSVDPKTGEPLIDKDTGEPKFGTRQWYHSRLQWAVLQYVDLGLKGAESCSEVLERIKTLEASVVKACEGRQ